MLQNRRHRFVWLFALSAVAFAQTATNIPTASDPNTAPNTRIVGSVVVPKYRPVVFEGGTASVIPQVGLSSAFGISAVSGNSGDMISVIAYGTAVCEFDENPSVGNMAIPINGKCHDFGNTNQSLIAVTQPLLGRILSLRPDLCGTCAEINEIGPDHYGSFQPRGVLSGSTLAIGGAPMAAGDCINTVVSVVGATANMAAAVSPATFPGPDVDWKAYVSAASKVTVLVCARVPVTPVSSIYRVRVIQ